MINQINNICQNHVNMFIHSSEGAIQKHVATKHNTNISSVIWSGIVEFVDFNWNIVQSNIMDFRK